MKDGAEIIPFGGKGKEDYLDQIMDEIREKEYTAAFIVMGEDGRIRYGHTAKTLSELITINHFLNKLTGYCIEDGGLSILYQEEEEED